MLHHVHQVVTNFVCQPFGAEQRAYSQFLELFHWKQLLTTAENKVDDSSETETKQLRPGKPKQWAERLYKAL